MPFRALSRLTHTQAVFLMVAVTLMWSIAGVVSRQLESAARFEVTFWRSAFTALSLLLILPLWRAADRASGALVPKAGEGLLHRHWGVLPGSTPFWISGLCWSVMFTAFMLALTFTTVANVLIIMSVGPLLTALVARFTLGQRLALRTWAAIVAAGLGIVYMYGSQFLQELLLRVCLERGQDRVLGKQISQSHSHSSHIIPTAGQRHHTGRAAVRRFGQDFVLAASIQPMLPSVRR